MPTSRAPSRTSACTKTSSTSWRVRYRRAIRSRVCFSSRWVGLIRMETEFGIKKSSTPTHTTVWASIRHRHTAEELPVGLEDELGESESRRFPLLRGTSVQVSFAGLEVSFWQMAPNLDNLCLKGGE